MSVGGTMGGNILAGAAVVFGLFLAIVNVPVALSNRRAIAVLKVDDFLDAVKADNLRGLVTKERLTSIVSIVIGIIIAVIGVVILVRRLR